MNTLTKTLGKRLTAQEVPDLPQIGLLRIKQVLQFVPVSRSHWWQGVKEGRFPKPVKLSRRVTCWKVADIRRLVEIGNCDNPGVNQS
jgi:prophage regulatory protein